MTSITFDVPGKVVGKMRPRVTQNGTYTPKASRDYERAIKWAAKAAGATEIAGPVRVLVRIYIKPPKSMSQKDRLLAIDRVIRPLTKPDTDNVLKAVLDALNGIAYEDDKQVCDVAVSKFYAHEPSLSVTVGVA